MQHWCTRLSPYEKIEQGFYGKRQLLATVDVQDGRWIVEKTTLLRAITCEFHINHSLTRCASESLSFKTTKNTKKCQIINNVQILDLVWQRLNYYDLFSTANDLHFFLTIFFVYLNFNQFVVSDHLNHSTSFFQKDIFPSWMNKTHQKNN